MKIPQFEMERMQSTWENVVEMDLSESGVRPVTLRELAAKHPSLSIKIGGMPCAPAMAFQLADLSASVPPRPL